MTILSKQNIIINNCQTNYLRGGNGEPLLYLHGAGGSANATPAMTQLADTFDIILPDHPGFGETEEPTWLDNIYDITYFYLDFIEALELEHVNLAGSSLGGWIALEMAIRNGSCLKSLTLCAPAGIYVKGSPPGDIFLWSPEEMIRRAIYNQDIAETILAETLTEEQQEAAMKNFLMVTKLAWEPRLHNPHLEKWLHRIKVPTHLIWGDSDQIIPTIYADTLKSIIPNSEVSIISKCGHLPHVEATSKYVELVSSFVKRRVS